MIPILTRGMRYFEDAYANEIDSIMVGLGIECKESHVICANSQFGV